VGEETLGDRIRRLRMERGLSLARVAGGDFSRAFLNQVELGRSQPSTRVLRVIASRLGAPVEYLLEGSTPYLDRELAVERARLAVAKGDARRALALLEPALDAPEWPLGCDARLAAAEALLELGRAGEAAPLLAGEETAVEAHRDPLRRRRLRALRTGRAFRLAAGDARAEGDAYLRRADTALRQGRGAAALELYRAARILVEATGSRRTYTKEVARRSGA